MNMLNVYGCVEFFDIYESFTVIQTYHILYNYRYYTSSLRSGKQTNFRLNPLKVTIVLRIQRIHIGLQYVREPLI